MSRVTKPTREEKISICVKQRSVKKVLMPLGLLSSSLFLEEGSFTEYRTLEKPIMSYILKLFIPDIQSNPDGRKMEK